MAFKLDNIKQEKPSESIKKNNLEAFLKKEIVLFGESFGNKKKQSFYQELGVLLNAGITIKEALTLIIESLKKNNDKDLITKVLNDIVDGNLLSEALKKQKNFSEYEYYSLQIGEETGTTSKVCNELGSFYERKNEQKRIIISALTYPLIVISTSILVVVFMLTYVVPMFQDIFRQNNMELPLLTQIIVKLSELLKQYGSYIFLLFLGLIITSHFLKKNANFKKITHKIILKLPIIGSFITKVHLAQFTQAVALLTAAKVPMLNSIQMVKKMIQFTPLQEALEMVEQNILKGNSLSSSLMKNSLFDNRIISLVKVAEETNQTEYVFKQLNEQFNQEVINQSKIMTTILEPFIILFVGVIVAVLLIAIYLPMFQLSSIIG